MKIYIIMSGLDFKCTVDDVAVEAVYTNKKHAQEKCDILKKENKYRDCWIEERETSK